MTSCLSPAAICVWGSLCGTTRAQFMSWTRRRPRAVSDHRSSFLLWDGTSTGWVVVTSGASLPLARVAWLGFVCRGELPEILDLFLQPDHLESTPSNQPLELLQLGQPVQRGDQRCQLQRHQIRAAG